MPEAAIATFGGPDNIQRAMTLGTAEAIKCSDRILIDLADFIDKVKRELTELGDQAINAMVHAHVSSLATATIVATILACENEGEIGQLLSIVNTLSIAKASKADGGPTIGAAKLLQHARDRRAEWQASRG